MKNYVEMLDLTKIKLNNLNIKINLIETNINKISSDNADKTTTFKTTLSQIRSHISILISQVETLQDSLSNNDITELKVNAKQLRKESKTLTFSLIDFNDEVMRILDSEITINNSNTGGDDVVLDNATLLTEDGFVLLTEDGLTLLADGIETSTALADAILTEMGIVILTEDGKQILKG